MQAVTDLWKSGILGKLTVIGVPIMGFCCLCVLFIYFVPPPGGTTAALPTMTPILDLPLEMTSTSEPTSMPESTDTPAPTATIGPLGETRDQPYPVDAVVDIGDDMQLSILSVTRPANEEVHQANQFNDEPATGLEYAMLRLRVQCNKSTNDKCSFSGWYLHMVGADGTVRDDASVASIPDDLDSTTEFFGGANIEGDMVFLIPEADTSVVLFYEPLFSDSPIFIALQ